MAYAARLARQLARMASSAGSGDVDPADQVAWVGAEWSCDANNGVECGAGLAALEVTDVGAVQTGELCERFLGEPERFTSGPDSGSEPGGEVLISRPPSHPRTISSCSTHIDSIDIASPFMIRSARHIAGVALAIMLSACSSSNNGASPVPTPLDSNTQVELSTSTTLSAYGVCVDDVTISVISIEQAGGLQAGYLPLAYKFGTESPKLRAIVQLYADYDNDALEHGRDSANTRLRDSISATCTQLAANTSPADTLQQTLPSLTGDEAPDTVDTTAALPVNPDDDSAVDWWTQGPQPTPAFLADVVRRWSSGEIPVAYAQCPLAGTISEPQDWGAGSVTLAVDDAGGWKLAWPGTYDKYVRVLTGAEVDNNPNLASLERGAADTTSGSYEEWTGDNFELLHSTSDGCWYQWGISPDAPQGEQRAFYEGMRFLAPPGPASEVGTGNEAGTTTTPQSSTACPVGGTDVLKLKPGASTGCPDVQELQDALLALGYTPEDNGIYGAATTSAVRSFQADHGLDVDGLAGPDTWLALIGGD
ncbi:MAG: cwlA [Aeromicrobium sp.]|nr:cwlA [Aeromicrobium sp.]